MSRHQTAWEKALSGLKSKLSVEDQQRLQDAPPDPNQIRDLLLARIEKSPNRNANPTIQRIKQLAKLLSIFTSSIPEVSSVLWISLSLIHERSSVNAETRALFEQAIENVSSAIPQFAEYEEVFADMSDVEATMIQYYCKVIELFIAVLDSVKRSSSWTHRIGVLPAPIAINRAVEAMRTQKEVVEKTVFAANTTLQSKRHKEIHVLLSQLAMQTKPTSQLPCRLIPYSANPNFHGRQEILDKINAHLLISRNVRSSFAISGLGGVGKTQIALKYIYDHLDQYPAIFWMQADTHQKLAQSYASAADRLRLESQDSQKDTDAVTAVLKSWLGETKDHWLIIYDNADDLSVLKPFWPPGNQGCIIITSRDPASVRMASAGTQVPPFSPVEGETCFISLLTTHADDGAPNPHDPKLVKTIVKQLGYLPLAIVHVSSFIVENNCTLEEFEELYTDSQQSNQHLWDLEVSTANLFYEHSIASVWKVSITRLRPNCLRLLRILSCFDPDGVPEILLWEGSKGNDALSDLRRGVTYFNAIHELISRGLVAKGNIGASTDYTTANARSLSVHRLVQETIFHQLDGNEQNEIFGHALDILLEAWPVNKDNPFRMNSLWPQCSLYIPHVLALEARSRDSPYIKPPSRVVRLFFYASWYLFERRMSELAFPLLQTARDICARDGDTDSFFPKLLTAYGSVHLECDQVPLAAEKYSQVVDCYRRRAEPNDWLLATALSDLAVACTDMGAYERSEKLLEESLRIASSIPDPAGKDWQVHVGHNFARLLCEMGRPEEALRLHFSHGDEFASGLIQENSQRGALFMYGIGNTHLELARQKGIEGAEEREIGYHYHTRALKVRSELCGEHYITGISLHKVGVLLHESGDYGAAEKALQHAINIFDEAFNAEREYARSLFHLSMVKSHLNAEVEASRLLTEAWQYQEKTTGIRRNTANEKDRNLFDKLVFYVHH